MSEAMMAAAKLYNDPKYFNPSEIRIRKNKIRRQRIVRRQFILLGLFVSIILFGIIFFCSAVMSDAQSDNFTPEYKYYKTITVHSGDTLWEIASDNYNSDKYSSMSEYMGEIMSINSLDNSSNLNAGEDLIVPYYSAEFK